MASGVKAAVGAPELPKTLIEAAKRGDPEALDRLARQELARVERLLLRLLGPRPDLEDLVQTVFLELCRALPGFRGDSKLSTFVGGITVRVARRAMRPSAWLRRRADLELEAVDPALSPHHRAEAQERLRRVRQALARISPKKRIAFLLWALEGLTPEAIAEMTDASVSATRSRIHYAKKELKARARRDPVLAELVEELEA